MIVKLIVILSSITCTTQYVRPNVLLELCTYTPQIKTTIALKVGNEIKIADVLDREFHFAVLGT